MIPVCMTESYWDLFVCILLFELSLSYQVHCASFRGQLPHIGSAAHWVSLLPRLGHHFPMTALWPYCVKFCCPWVWARILLVKSIFKGMQSVGSGGVKDVVTKPDSLSSNPLGLHGGRREPAPTAVLWSPHVHCGIKKNHNIYLWSRWNLLTDFPL